MHRFKFLAVVIAATTAHSLNAQTVIRVWPGVAPGSEHWTQKERVIENTPVGTVVFNVVTPTLTVFLPDRSTATGTGIIIAPGGAFVALTTSLEGDDLARWLSARGIAAFVLKYRIVEKKFEGIPEMDMDTAGRYGIADGIQSIKVIRQHAKQWGISPDRVGFIGFSAGAMVASATVLQKDAAARPNFAAMIYGGPFGVMPSIPDKLPPLFLAWAKDDQVALTPILRFRDALAHAGIKPELHEYAAGGHGFGMKKQGTPSDHWIDDFYTWLESQGLTIRAHANFTLQSKVLGESRLINVYTPPQYNGRTRFPVLYMPDGGIDEDFPHVVRTVDSLIALHAIRPVMVVGIPNTQRRRDLTGPTRFHEDSAIAPRVGGSAAFRQFIRTELIPEINRRYRTTPERGIIGESLAGLFIVETFLEDPDLFTHYVALDPSVWWNGGALIDSLAAKRIASLDSKPRSFYFASSLEPGTSVRSAKLAELLKSFHPAGLRWIYAPRPDLTHGNIFRALKPTALVDAFRPTQTAARTEGSAEIARLRSG